MPHLLSRRSCALAWIKPRWTQPRVAPDETYPSAQPGLPSDVFIEIFAWLPLADLVNIRSVSRGFRDIVDDSSDLQLRIELQIAGYDSWFEEGVGRVSTNVERLQHLKVLRERWARPSISKGLHLPADVLQRMQSKQYCGNIFVGRARSAAVADPRLWDTVCCLCIETRNAGAQDEDDDGSAVTNWELHFSDAFQTVAVDPGQRLLILLKISQEPVGQDWCYEIRVASVITGELQDINGSPVLRLRAPTWQYFYETPNVQIHGDLVAIAVARPYDAKVTPKQLVEVTIVKYRTGCVESIISREFPQHAQLELYSFLFVSRRSFMLAVTQPGRFTLELHAIKGADTSGSGALQAVHYATYEFPRLRPGCTTTGLFQPLVKSYCTSLDLNRRTGPCNLAPSRCVVQVNRAYHAESGAGVRVTTVIPMSVFLQAERQYLDPARRQGRVSSYVPRVVPWEDWGPKRTRAFSKDLDVVLSCYGSRLLMSGSKIFDFNTVGTFRDLLQQEHAGQAGPSHSRFSRLKRRFASSHRNMELSDPAQLVCEPTRVPHSGVFTADIVTELPYIEKWAHSDCIFNECAPVYGGEVWVAQGRLDAHTTSVSDMYVYNLTGA